MGAITIFVFLSHNVIPNVIERMGRVRYRVICPVESPAFLCVPFSSAAMAGGPGQRLMVTLSFFGFDGTWAAGSAVWRRPRIRSGYILAATWDTRTRIGYDLR